MRRRGLQLTFLLAAISVAPSGRLNCQVLASAVNGNTIASPASMPVKEVKARDEYVIGPDDILAVNVWKETEISRSVPVRPDGKISLPLIGDLPASGRTPVQLQRDIKQQLLAYLSNPEVTVVVQEVKSHKFNIVGEVQKPGSYVMSGPMTVLDAIAVAGGLRDFAKETRIYVLRATNTGSPIRLPFNYKRIIKGNDLRQNVELEPRDTIVVP